LSRGFVPQGAACSGTVSGPHPNPLLRKGSRHFPLRAKVTGEQGRATRPALDIPMPSRRTAARLVTDGPAVAGKRAVLKRVSLRAGCRLMCRADVWPCHFGRLERTYETCKATRETVGT
jgi:hypothetical protein